jgi:hypothetical protein
MRCFSSLRSLPLARVPGVGPGRFPDLGDLRIIACLAASRSISQLSHVLHRLWTPRHPPYTLCSLTTLFLISCVIATPRTSSPCFQRASATRDAPRSELGPLSLASPVGSGGGDRIRTDDRLVANQVLYQLSYAPGAHEAGLWWAWGESHSRPPAYQADALTTELQALGRSPQGGRDRVPVVSAA